MDDIIQIKCPFDGAVLSVRNMPGIESKNVTCPICKHKFPFTQFRRVSPVPGNEEDPQTEYPFQRDNIANSDTERTTAIAGAPNFSLGRLLIPGSGIYFQLKPGRNVVGRKGQKSMADFQIDTPDKRNMSREHLIIEVKKIPVKGFVHYASLFKEKVNKTFIGSEQLLFGDCIVLNNGDLIKLPDAILKFEIPDEEATEM